MSSNIRSDNFYYTKDTLADNTHDDFATVDIGSPVATAKGTPSSNTASDVQITKALRKKCDQKHLLIISLVTCNSVLTMISLVVAIVSIQMVLKQGKEQSTLSKQVLNVKEHVFNETSEFDMKVRGNFIYMAIVICSYKIFCFNFRITISF